MNITVGNIPVIVELAVTEEQQALGLMYRKSLLEDHGMLFVYPKDTIPSFWMKNTYLVLSIAFINNDGTIVHIDEMEPLNEQKHYQPPVPVKYVLEMRGGWFTDNDINIGDNIDFTPESEEYPMNKKAYELGFQLGVVSIVGMDKDAGVMDFIGRHPYLTALGAPVLGGAAGAGIAQLAGGGRIPTQMGLSLGSAGGIMTGGILNWIAQNQKAKRDVQLIKDKLKQNIELTEEEKGLAERRKYPGLIKSLVSDWPIIFGLSGAPITGTMERYRLNALWSKLHGRKDAKIPV